MTGLLADERRVLETFAVQRPRPSRWRPSSTDLSELLLGSGLESIEMARRAKISAVTSSAKADRSPVTALDHAIEERLRELVRHSGLDATVVGEEQGGAFTGRGCEIAIDPVDGTWAFINGGANFATSIAVFADGKVIAAMVANPSTGEIIYGSGAGCRLLQLGRELEESRSCRLPQSQANAALLVHLHPARAAKNLAATSMKAWSHGDVDLVMLHGGSPAWGLAECAKGSFAYVNLWAASHTNPFDLAAGVMLVRGAGGDVVDEQGCSIDENTHRGVFVAACSQPTRERVLELVKNAG
jgi:myo-inositol-1(or 4)-monophosphatase